MAVAGAALRGAARILAVGTRPVCVEAARKYGATDFISYKNGQIDEQVLALTSGRLDVKPLITHVFDGWDKLPQALQLMKDKPQDLIKPVVRL